MWAEDLNPVAIRVLWLDLQFHPIINTQRWQNYPTTLMKASPFIFPSFGFFTKSTPSFSNLPNSMSAKNYLVFSTWHKLHQHLAQQAQCGQTLWDHCCHWAVIDMCSEMKKWSKPMVRQPLFTLCSPIMGQLQSGRLREGPPWEFASHHVFGSLNRQIAHLLLSVSSWGIEEGSANPRK